MPYTYRASLLQYHYFQVLYTAVDTTSTHQSIKKKKMRSYRIDRRVRRTRKFQTRFPSNETGGFEKISSRRLHRRIHGGVYARPLSTNPVLKIVRYGVDSCVIKIQGITNQHTWYLNSSYQNEDQICPVIYWNIWVLVCTMRPGRVQNSFLDVLVSSYGTRFFVPCQHRANGLREERKRHVRHLYPRESRACL